MYRIATEKLLKWKESKRRKPLIIEGARQVGKTWLMKEFGKLYYTDTVYINFDSNSRSTFTKMRRSTTLYAQALCWALPCMKALLSQWVKWTF